MFTETLLRYYPQELGWLLVWLLFRFDISINFFTELYNLIVISVLKCVCEDSVLVFLSLSLECGGVCVS